MNPHLKLAYDHGVQQALVDAGLVKESNAIYPPGSVFPGPTMAMDPVTRQKVNISGVTYLDAGPDRFRGMDPKIERAFKSFSADRLAQQTRQEADIAKYLKSQRGLGGGALSRLGMFLATRR